ncbi:putative secreted effector protein [Erysiphe necator]|uniref:Putative secreted effector protein n=1 Tax=Uncinula necator TaxID=52586 RepID=A0A0B1NUY7_UNCNE|nr:putative secreted effector protein [Erysiphe necator]
MHFPVGAIASILVLSPVSVLSMAISAESTDLAPKAIDNTIQTYNNQLGHSAAPPPALDKRFFLIPRGKNREQKRSSGFQCRKKYISPGKVEKAKAAACPRIKDNKQRHVFPLLHTVTEFDAPGPYLEWPISRDGWVWNRLRKGKYRIILTLECEVVGAVIRKKNSSYLTCKNLSKGEDEDKDEDGDGDDDDDDESESDE